MARQGAHNSTIIRLGLCKRLGTSVQSIQLTVYTMWTRQATTGSKSQTDLCRLLKRVVGRKTRLGSLSTLLAMPLALIGFLCGLLARQNVRIALEQSVFKISSL